MNNPRMLKNSLLAQLSKMGYYAEGWTPKFEFLLQGPTPAGGEMICEIKKPDNSAWLELRKEINETSEEETTRVDIASYENEHHTPDTGEFPFTIRLVSELDGVDEELFSGVLNVQQTDNNYFVSHDWLLPAGRLWIDTYHDNDAPPLNASVWLKGNVDTYQLGAYLFYNGKRIYSTENRDHADIDSRREITTTSGSADENSYREFVAAFRVVKGYLNCEYADMSDWHILLQNPGEYEIKFALERKPVRSIKFSVGENGRITHAGPIAQNQSGVPAMTVDVTVTAKDETDFDRDALASQVFYGNPGLESDLTTDEMYTFCKQSLDEAEDTSDGLSDETRELLEKTVGKATNVFNWYYEEMTKGVTASGYEVAPDQCDLAKMYVDEVSPMLERLEEELGGDFAVEFQGEEQTLETIKNYVREIRDGADRVLTKGQQAKDDALAPYRELLRNDKLKIFEEHPANEYRYYTSKKEIIESAEELANAPFWYFEGAENQGYLNERWTVRGWKFDEEHNVVDKVEESGFGVNAPSSAFA